ncbi:MAG TPA: hypothetical protein VGM69_20620 [Chloroflexota bacterium]|jgi:hypothetical protein
MGDRGHGDRAGEYAWMALGVIRLINGLLALFAPGWLAGRLGVEPGSQPAVHYVLRMFGIRTVLIGADLWLNPGGRRRALQEGILIHASDATAALIAGLSGQLPFRAALTAGLISSTNTALAIFAYRRAG